MMLVIAIVVGALVGAAASGEAGALAGALFAWLIVRTLRQQREIDALRKRAETPVAAATAQPLAPHAEAAPMRASTSAPQAEGVLAPASAVEPAPASAVEPAPFAVMSDAPSAPSEDMSREAVRVDEAPAVSAARATVAGDGVPAAPRRDLLAPIRQWLFGGNTIVKAGVGILFVGLAFLAKYASEHAHLPVEVRLAAIGAAAIVLLGFGWRLRRSRPEYAQVLQGGAVAVLYLTLFAAFRYYGVLDATPAFVLMVAVAALAAALAVLQDARSLAVVGALGGFATPLIVSTGSNNHVALFRTTSCSTPASRSSRGRRPGGCSTWSASSPPSSSRRPGACSSTGPRTTRRARRS